MPSAAHSRLIRACVLEASVAFQEQKFRKPLQLSTGLISEVTEAVATVRVESAGRSAVGRGSIYLSDLWAWPDPNRSHAERDRVLREYAKGVAEKLPDLCGNEAAHPLELGLRLHHAIESEKEFPGIPLLAKAMAASPFDAAIHDALGNALGISAFDFYREPAPVPSGDEYFSGGGAVRAIFRHLRAPVKKFPVWWIVGARDVLENDLAPVLDRGVYAFKLKILGKDSASDAARTAEVFRFARGRGAAPRLSVDSNEANPDPQSVMEYLERLERLDPAAYAALEYLEQPTARDIEKHPFDWKAVAARKPVMLDEGLTRLGLFAESARQGWSGFALKTCKGHSFALLAAAWALENKKIISLQDLTNPGLSAIHAALFAAHLPTVNGVELNSPQYTPGANAAWLPRLGGLFAPNNGEHTIDFDIPRGLGSGV